ncbi:hypothetical protein EBR96_09605, partial [bacterium]|nr:hypothetical protein [bacterium]
PDPELAGVFPVSFKSIPYSHSLAAAVFWAVVLAAVVYYVRRPKGLGVLYIGVLVVSHWFFDLLFHRADLPLLPWDKGVYGYGLWGSFGATVGISVLIFCIGLFFYWQAARQANSRIGRVFWCVMIALVGIFLGDAMVTPALIDDVVTGFLLLWLLVPLGKWVDFTRPDAYVAIR